MVAYFLLLTPTVIALPFITIWAIYKVHKAWTPTERDKENMKVLREVCRW